MNFFTTKVMISGANLRSSDAMVVPLLGGVREADQGDSHLTTALATCPHRGRGAQGVPRSEGLWQEVRRGRYVESVTGRGPVHQIRGNAMRATTKKSVLASATGALALSLLLAGCSGSGSGDSGSDGSGSGDSGSGDSSSEASAEEIAEAAPERTGALPLPADCEEVGTRLGDLVAGLQPSAGSSVDETEAFCSWETAEGDPAGVRRVAFFVANGDAYELGFDKNTESLPGATVEEIDDERAEPFDGTTYTASLAQAGLTGTLATVSTPEGGVGVASVGTGETAPAEQLVDLTFEFID